MKSSWVSAPARKFLMSAETEPLLPTPEVELLSEETLRFLGSFCISGLAWSVTERQISRDDAVGLYNSWFPGDVKGLTELYKRTDYDA